MTLGDLLDRERRDATREAVKENTIENIMELLEDVGDIPSDLSERLEDIQDIDCLKKLHKIAARVDSIEAFEEKCAKLSEIILPVFRL